jgi:hypothetical protein
MRADRPPSQAMQLNRAMSQKYGAGSAAQYQSGPGFVTGSAPI